MLAYLPPRPLQLGIIQAEIDEAIETGVHEMPLFDGLVSLKPSPLIAGNTVPVEILTADEYLLSKVQALGSIGVYAELDEASNVDILADLTVLRQRSMIQIPENQIFVAKNRTGPAYKQIILSVSNA
jgi:hypothetical protein